MALELRVPGDKSIAHRALLFGLLAEGVSRIRNVPGSADVAATVRAARAFGGRLDLERDEATLHGGGLARLHAPDAPIDCGNSGTTARLCMGLAAALPGATTLDGDASLRARPMARVADPLRAAGARIDYLGEEGRLPLRVSGGALSAIEHRSAVASAQVKSALLLAGCAAGVDVVLQEPAPSRNHTELLLKAMGAPVGRADGTCVSFQASGRGPLRPLEVTIPGDVSSAAFLLAGALFAGTGLVVRDVGLNPTRTGFLDIAQRMGARIAARVERTEAGEPVGDIRIEPCALAGTEVDGTEVLRALDELPLVAMLGAHARGETVVRGAAELRIKESDRIRAVVANLTALGVDAEERPDGFVVRGSDAPLEGRVRAFGDHRIAMAFAVLGLRPGSRIEVDDLELARISYPGFAAQIEHLRRTAAAIGGRA